MGPRNDAEAMHLLKRWRRTRDLRARDDLTMYVFNKWAYRVETKRLFSQDPMQDRDDMRQIFFEAILVAVEKLDERGDPLFHLSQRGFWAVGSALRVTATRRKLVNADVSDVESPPDEDRAPYTIKETEPDFAEAVIRTLDAEQVVRRTQFRLSGRVADTFACILSGQAGDPSDKHFNQQLAKSLGVSEQRASQLKAKLRDQLEQASD